jgi:hypothetical protein
MSSVPDSSTTLKPTNNPRYIEIGIDTRDFEQYTPYDRSPIEQEDSIDHELGLLEAGYNVSPLSPLRSPRSPFQMAVSEDGLLEPARLHIPSHSRKISKGSIVRTNPTSEGVVLTDETDMMFLEEQRRFQIAKARRQRSGSSFGSGSSFDKQEMDILRHEQENMI